MGRRVPELQREMGAQEWLEWVAFYQLEPWGEWRADLRAGIVASTIANANGPRGRRFAPKDFMPFEKKLDRSQSLTEMHTVWRAFKARHNRQVEEGRS